MGGKVCVFTFRAELTTRTDPFTLFGSANGTCSCNICQAAKAARPFLTIEDLSHQPHLPPLLHFPAGPQQTLTFCDAWLPGCSLLLTSMHAPQNCHPAVLWNSVDTRVPLNAWLQLCPGSFERSSKSLYSPPHCLLSVPRACWEIRSYQAALCLSPLPRHVWAAWLNT